LKEDKVIITTGIMHELQKELIGDMGGLKSLAELLRWEYKPRHSFREGNKVRTASAILMSRDELTAFLTPKPE